MLVREETGRSRRNFAGAFALGLCVLTLPSVSRGDSFRVVAPMLSSSSGVATAPGWSLHAVLGSAISDATIARLLPSGSSAAFFSAVSVQSIDTAPSNSPQFTFSLSCASPIIQAGGAAITYAIGSASGSTRVNLRVFDLAGRLVTTLFDGDRQPGIYKVAWNTETDSRAPVQSGIYFCHIDAGAFHATTRMVLIR
jgi:hypothetical protein